MATQSNNNYAYGFTAPTIGVPNEPIISPENPTINDAAQPGTQWINDSTGDIFFMTRVVGGDYTWQQAQGASVITTSITINPGPSVFNGDFSVVGDAVGISATTTMNLTATGAGTNITLDSQGGSLVGIGSEDAPAAVQLVADGGVSATLRLDNTLGTGLDAIDINCPNGGIDIDVDSFALDTVDTLDLTAATNMTLGATAGFLNATAGTDVTITASGGDANIIGSDIVNLEGQGVFANAINIQASDLAGGIRMAAGTAGLALTNTGTLSLAAAAASDITVTGAFDLDLASTLGKINITAGEVAADSIKLQTAVGGGIDVNAGSLGITVDATGAGNIALTNDSGDINATTASGDVNLTATAAAIIATAGTSIDLRPTTALSMASANTVTTIEMGNISPTVNRTTTINGGAVITANTDVLNLATGGLNTNAGAAKTVNIATGANLLGTTTLNLGTGTAASGLHTVNIGTGTGGGTKLVNVGNADGLTTITARGAITLDGGTSGSVRVTNVQVSTAAPGPGAIAAATNDVRVGSVTFSGFIQAASSSVVLTLTNSFITATSAILASVTNGGVNDAQMYVSRINPQAGFADITIVNGGAAALNGDMILTFWVLS